MNKFYLLLLLSFYLSRSYSQSDNCSGAITLTVVPTCGSPVSGSTAGFTQNFSGCVGNADDDGWYKFVATSTSHSITVTGSSTFDAVVEVFSGTCSSLTSLACMDNTFNGQAEAINLTGLIVTNTYYIRVYNYGSGSGSSAFTICLTNSPPPPANDACLNAVNLSVNTSCSNTTGTTYGATTQTLYPACTGTADDDVWYKFTANSYTQTITMTGSSGMDGVLELFSGTCSGLTSITCMDNTFTGGIETINAVGLNPGQVYYIRTYDYYSGGGYSFSICVVGSPIGGGQPNDNPCSAIQLPAVTSDCNYLTFSTVGATNTGAGLAPTPFSCTGGSGGSGGFSSGSLDVWFKITVPASGNIYITPLPNQGAGYITDGSMALYSGSCGSLTQITCSSDYTLYPGSSNDLLPYIAATGQTPGATLYLRYWAFGTSSGNFGICVQSPTNDNCANALYVCDINGYSGSTSAAYTPDRPGTGAGQMYANNETAAGVNQPDGTNTCGPFGYYPACPATTPGPYSSPAIDVNIENNSWITFTAANPTVILRVTISNCWVGNYPSGGIQMQIFSGSGCNNFIPVSSFKEGSSTFTVTASGLTIGNNYYLMVDGYAKDICNYTIQALSGVAFPAIVATPTAVCPGQSSVLTAPSGATSYEWFPSGETTQVITVTPGTTQSYTCIVGGICGYKQTLSTQIVVKAIPVVSINSGAAIVNCGTKSTTLTASGASTYTWSTGSSSNPITVSPPASQSYSVVGTGTNGCVSSAVTNVTVNTIPAIVPAGTNTICNGSSTGLTVSGASTYTWSPTASLSSSTGTAVTASPTVGTNYTIIGTATNGCTNSATYSVTVNSIPTTTVSTTGTITCTTPTINLNSTAVSGATYTWTPPSGSSISGGTANNQNAIGQGAGTYTLNVMSSASCSFSATLAANINTTTPTASATGGTLTCAQTSTVLVGGPASGVSYNWSGPGISGSTTSSNATATVIGTYSLVTTNTLSGCSNSITTIVTNNLTTPTVSAGSNQTITCSAPTVTLTGGATTGSTFNWSSGGTTNTTTVSGAGVYTLTAMNPTSGCTASSTVEVLPSAGTPNGVVGAVTNSITCSNTSVAVSITSTVSPLTYSWTGPGTIASPTSSATSVSSGGTYTITITNTASCSQSYAVFVPTDTNPVVASASITSSSQSITCNTSSVTLSSNPIGSNYTYSWTGPNIISGAASANPVVGAGGNYVVTITNTVNGCSGVTGTTNIAVPTNTVAPTLSLSANSLTTTCGAPSTTVVASSNSNPNTTYTWTAPGTGTIDNVNISTPLLGGSGVFTVAVTNTVNGCVSAAATVTITPDVNIPTFNLASNTATITCADPSPSVSLTSTVSGVTYSWSPTPSSGITSASPTFTATGNYTCLITNPANGCSTNAAQVAVTDNTIVPIVSITPGVSVTCAPTSVTVLSSVNTTVTYTWTGTGIQGSSNTSSISVNAAGVYSVVVTDPSNGCISSASTSVGTNTTPPAVTFSSTSTVLTCSTGSSTLTALTAPTNTITWAIPGGGSSISNTVVALSAGDYTATVIDGANGCQTFTTISITNNITPPNANAGAAVVMPCNMYVTTLVGSSTDTDPVSYSWSGPSGGSIISGNNSATPTVTDTGVYTLTVTNLVTGCTATSTVNVSTDNVSADFTADPMIGEIPLTVNFTNTSIGANSYSWTFGNGLTSSLTNPNTVYNNVGTYTVMLVASSNFCSDTITKIIIAEDGFTIEIPNVFTPNGDGANDVFHIRTTGVKSAEGSIYNRWGQLLFSWDALNNSWDGKAVNGENCPDGTYYYLIKVIDKKDKEHIAPGYVLIAR